MLSTKPGGHLLDQKFTGYGRLAKTSLLGSLSQGLSLNFEKIHLPQALGHSYYSLGFPHASAQNSQDYETLCSPHIGISEAMLCHE